MIEAVIKSLCTERISAKGGVGGIDISGFEADAKQLHHPVGKADEDQEQQRNLFHVALILSTLPRKWSSRGTLTSCIPYQVRSKIETFSAKRLIVSGNAWARRLSSRS